MGMTDSQKLTDLLRRWEELTDAESEAIAAEAWARLKTVQTAKFCLQEKIGVVHDRLLENGTKEEIPDWQELVTRLIAREIENRDEIGRRRGGVEAERESGRRTGQRLNRLLQAYSPDQGRQWSTYT
jgi:hypothetical protein